MLTQVEFDTLQIAAKERKLNKTQLLTFIKDNFVGDTNHATASNNYLDRKNCVSKIKADPDEGLSALQKEHRKQGVFVATESLSAKVDGTKRKSTS